jgi:chemotaxis protein CheX
MAVVLPRNLDFAAARPLWQELQQARGAPVAVDASQVERLGGLCLQVLLAASAEWRAAGHEFRIDAASQAFVTALETMGADLECASMEAA